MADIAAIFHWPLSELETQPLTDLYRWQALAVERFERMHRKKES